MITLLFKSYFAVLITTGLACVAILLAGIYSIFRINTPKHSPSNDLSSIAGDDVLSTQLDLARAYLETNNKHLAKPILRLVLEQGSKTQITEARMLLSLM